MRQLSGVTMKAEIIDARDRFLMEQTFNEMDRATTRMAESGSSVEEILEAVGAIFRSGLNREKLTTSYDSS